MYTVFTRIEGSVKRPLTNKICIALVTGFNCNGTIFLLIRFTSLVSVTCDLMVPKSLAFKSLKMV